jgi:3-hydroxyisobutyrate dehydrogenase-like beta-hydroxyacid dehydrogenase
MQTIGFIGASGLMGHGIAKNLRANGHPQAESLNVPSLVEAQQQITGTRMVAR